MRAHAILVAALAVAPLATRAEAAPADRAAQKLDAEAMGRDYFEMRFPIARKKLERALAICGKKNCSAKVLARLHRDLGVVHIGGLGAVERGKQELKKALAIDPGMRLDNHFATPAIRRAFAQVRGSAAENAGEARIEHEPVEEQRVDTPVPLAAELAGASDATRLVVRFKGTTGTTWRSQRMHKSDGGGYVALLPCDAVASEGQLRYYLVAVTDEEIVAHDGSRTKPHRVAIRTAIEGPAPRLPGQEPPDRCGVKPAEPAEKPAPSGPSCLGAECGEVAPPKSSTRKNWFHLVVQQDVPILAGDFDVCTESSQVDGPYSCFRPAGSQYHGTPIAGADDAYATGASLATTRIQIGYDRVLVAGLTLGFRVGYAVRGGGPRPDGADVRPFMPFLAEARLAYWFGKDAFATRGVRPFLFACGGLAQVDAHVAVTVHEQGSAPEPSFQLDNPRQQDLDVYQHMGTGFAGGGAGLYFAIVPAVALGLDVKVMQLFPQLGTAIAPEFGFAAGI